MAAVCPDVSVDPDSPDSIKQEEIFDLHLASNLYEKNPWTLGYLTHTVKYLNVKPRTDSLFTRFLKVNEYFFTQLMISYRFFGSFVII